MKAKKKMGLLVEEGTENISETTERLNLNGYFAVCFRLIPGKSYTVQANYKILEGDPSSFALNLSEQGLVYQIPISTWPEGRFAISFTAGESANPTFHRLLLYSNKNLVQSITTWVDFTNIQLEEKPYPTTFTDGTRAPSLLRLPLTTPLPDDFGIGLSARMLHESTAKDRTFWQAGPYALKYDAAEEKIKMQYGEVEAAVDAEWQADDIVGVYGGQRDGKLFLQSKVAGDVGEEVESDLVQGEHPQIDTITIGSSADGESGHLNAVIADFAYHFTPEKIDPAGYLRRVPGGGD